ncbi:MAG: amidohydrolase family protein [Rubrimonas sp.]
MRIDAHQHFWAIARGDYGWLTPQLGSLWRDFGPGDLAPLIRAAGVEGTILVQAATTEAETDWMLAQAEACPWVLGVVGWTDFEAWDAPDRIARMARNPKLKGLRPMIQDIPDPEWMLGDALSPAFDAVQSRGLVFDALVRPPQLPALRALLDRRPDMAVVIDHAAKPAIAEGRIEDWADDMAAIARDSRAWCKLSGLVTEAGADWTVARLRPYVDHLLATFGPERLIWGSDWPVCTLAASYAQWVEATDALLAALTAAGRDAVLGGNAIAAYGLT